MSKVNARRLRTQGIKLQRIGTPTQAQKSRKEDDKKQAYSDQLAEAVSSSIQSVDIDAETTKEDVFAMVAAVLAPHVVDKVGKTALQRLAESHGASLTLGPNTVVMGPQHVVDSVKQEIVALAEKTEELPSGETTHDRDDDTAQTSTQDTTVESVSEPHTLEDDLHYSNASQDSTCDDSILDNDTCEQSTSSTKTTKRLNMPPRAKSSKRRKVMKSAEEKDDDVETDVNVNTVNVDTTNIVKIELGPEEESQIIEPISLQSVTKNLEDYELVYLEDGESLELVKLDAPEKKEPESEGKICEHCGYQAKNAQTLYLHQKNFHNQSQHNYKCDICFGTFGFASALRVHRQRHYENDDVTLKASAIIVHLQRREGKEDVLLEDSDREQIEKHERDMALLKQKPIVRLAKVKGNQATGLVQENTVREIESTTETDPDEIICDQDAAPEKILHLIKEKKAASTTEYQCMLCKTILHSQLALNKHISTLHVEQNNAASDNKKRTMMRHRADAGVSIHGPTAQEFQCSLCDFRCSRMQNFTRHVKNHENPDLYRCDECAYTNTRRCEVLRHKRNNHGEPSLECKYCHKMFRTQPTLNTHIAARHTKKYSEQCDVCGLILSSKLALRKHKQRNHSSNELLEKTHITCNKCGRGFKRKKDFLEHVDEFHNSVMGDNTQNENVVLEEDGSCFKCGICHTYKNKSAREVRKHIERIHCPKDKICKMCDKTFATEVLLAKHTQIEHLLEELSKCSVCDKMFKSKSKLRMHEMRVHSGVKRFACDVCNRQFLEKHQWKRHIEVHLPEDERSWRYACEVCGKRYRFKCNYDYHMIEHSDQPDAHRCQTCGRGFKTKHLLEAHRNTHSEERPFVCPYCGRGFKLKKYLDVHLLAHASEKFVCQACGRLFVSSTHLQRHLCKAVAIKAPLVNQESTSSEQPMFVISNNEGGEQSEMWAEGEQVVQIQEGQDSAGFLDEDIMGQILQGGQLVLMNGDVVRIQGGGVIEQQPQEETHTQMVEFQQGVKLEDPESEPEQRGEEIELEQQEEGEEVHLEQQGEGLLQLEQQEVNVKEEGEGEIHVEQPNEEDTEIEGEASIKVEQPNEGEEIIRELAQHSNREVIQLDTHEEGVQMIRELQENCEVRQIIEQQTGQKELLIGEQQEGESQEQTVYLIIS